MSVSASPEIQNVCVLECHTRILLLCSSYIQRTMGATNAGHVGACFPSCLMALTCCHYHLLLSADFEMGQWRRVKGIVFSCPFVHASFFVSCLDTLVGIEPSTALKNSPLKAISRNKMRRCWQWWNDRMYGRGRMQGVCMHMDEWKRQTSVHRAEKCVQTYGCAEGAFICPRSHFVPLPAPSVSILKLSFPSILRICSWKVTRAVFEGSFHSSTPCCLPNYSWGDPQHSGAVFKSMGSCVSGKDNLCQSFLCSFFLGYNQVFKQENNKNVTHTPSAVAQIWSST